MGKMRKRRMRESSFLLTAFLCLHFRSGCGPVPCRTCDCCSVPSPPSGSLRCRRTKTTTATTSNGSRTRKKNRAKATTSKAKTRTTTKMKNYRLEGELCRFSPFTPEFKTYILPTFFKEKCMSEVVIIDSIVIFTRTVSALVFRLKLWQNLNNWLPLVQQRFWTCLFPWASCLGQRTSLPTPLQSWCFVLSNMALSSSQWTTLIRPHIGMRSPYLIRSSAWTHRHTCSQLLSLLCRLSIAMMMTRVTSTNTC